MRGASRLAKIARWTARGQLADRIREFVGARRRARRIAVSDPFDAGWYHEQYPDTGGMDPALHYLLRGAAEGRQPGPGFDGERYLRENADVLASGENPLLHYLERGRREGRRIVPAGSPPPLPRLTLN